MGAWGFNSFENDGAGDLVADLVHGHDLTPVTEALDTVLEKDEYIEVDEAQRAVAAAEVIAFLRGKPNASTPQSLRDWLQSHQVALDSAWSDKATQAVNKVYAASEMRELWEEVDDFPDWQSAMRDLLHRLQL